MLAVYIRKRDRKNAFEVARDLKTKTEEHPHVEMVEEQFDAQSDKDTDKDKHQHLN